MEEKEEDDIKTIRKKKNKKGEERGQENKDEEGWGAGEGERCEE